jgi:hypothetical protein
VRLAFLTQLEKTKIFLALIQFFSELVPIRGDTTGVRKKLSWWFYQ